VITLNSKWEEFDTAEKWRQWLDLAANSEDEVARFNARMWATDEGCRGCIHFDAENFWCRLVEHPATHNPYLNDLGMACGGLGHEESQPDMFPDPF
jgi:hypothetical protein